MTDEAAINEFGETICYSHLSASAPPGGTGSEALKSIGRYRIFRKLGEGAFGTVYLGNDDQLDRSVAIKVPRINPTSEMREEVENSFMQEARQLAQLRHANIVMVHDVGVEDDRCYIVSEYLEGPDLNHWLQEHAPDWRESVRLVATLADALAEAHSQGVVHRDVKPANIIVTERLEGWSPVLVDFGLALSESSARSAGRRRGEIAGTPNFMAPEQARGEGHRIDGRTDIYALGVVLYRMLSGQLPFSSQSLAELLQEVIDDEPCPPRQFVRGIPRDLERICLKAMAKQIADRHTTAGDLANDLRGFLDQPAGDAAVYEEPDVVVEETKIARKARQEKAPRPRSPDTLRILIAEDHEVTRFKLKLDLEKWGHDVTDAEDGEEAWEFFQKEGFSIVITDWMMPNMDGLQLVQRIRGSNPAHYVYIIMLTAKAEKHDIVAGMGAGADDFLAKPFHRDELNVRLRAGKRIIEMNRALNETNRRMKRSLESAARIQRSYLPDSIPETPGFQFAWDYLPCDELGGDMLNVVPLDETHFGLYVLDVSGKGIPASLLATTISRLLSPALDASSLLICKDRGRPRIVEPEEVARNLNQQFISSRESGQFFTLAYGILDLETGEFRYTSAGHPPILRHRAKGEPDMLEGFGLPIGVAQDNEDYRQESVALEPGDRLMMYTNGLPNTPDPEGELFGRTRMLESAARHRGQSLEKCLASLLGEVKTFHDGAEVDDDVSVLAVEAVLPHFQNAR